MFTSAAVLLACLLMNGSSEQILQSKPASPTAYKSSDTRPQQKGVAESPIAVTKVLDSKVDSARAAKLYEPVIYESEEYPNGQFTNLTIQTNSDKAMIQSINKNETAQRFRPEQNSSEVIEESKNNGSFGDKIIQPLSWNTALMHHNRHRYPESSGHASQAVGGRPLSSFRPKDYPPIHGNIFTRRPGSPVRVENQFGVTEAGEHQRSTVRYAVGQAVKHVAGGEPLSSFRMKDYPPIYDSAVGVENKFGVTEAGGNHESAVGIGDNGKENKPLPWQVSVFSKKSERFRRVCGGSLVSRSAVISAAHCYWDDQKPGLLPASQFAVGAGETLPHWKEDYSSYTQQNDVNAIKVPSNFNGHASNNRADIALLLLARPFFTQKGVQPVCISFDRGLEERQLISGNVATTLGAFYNQQENKTSLQVLKVLYISLEHCRAALFGREAHYLTEDKICAGFKPFRSSLPDMCSQDAGAGLVFYLDEYQAKDIAVPLLRGVTSRSSSCTAHTPIFYTRVSAHKEFLEEHLGGVEEECAKHYPQRREFVKNTVEKQETEFVCNCFC